MHKILIVEDDRFLMDAYSAKFRRLKDVEVLLAHDGNEALDIISKQKPDVIMLDIVMPNKDGIAVLEALRTQNNKIPVIVATNLDGINEAEKAIELGAKDYIVKSDTSLKEIIEKVTKFLPAKSDLHEQSSTSGKA